MITLITFILHMHKEGQALRGFRQMDADQESKQQLAIGN
jgi:hypothetical protein